LDLGSGGHWRGLWRYWQQPLYTLKECFHGHLKLNHALHEQIILLSVKSKNIQAVEPENALEVNKLGRGVFQVTASYGFMQSPDIPRRLTACPDFKAWLIPENTTYFIGHQTLLLEQNKSRMAKWRRALFVFMSRKAWSAAGFFNLPRERVIEIGMQVEI